MPPGRRPAGPLSPGPASGARHLPSVNVPRPPPAAAAAAAHADELYEETDDVRS